LAGWPFAQSCTGEPRVLRLLSHCPLSSLFKPYDRLARFWVPHMGGHGRYIAVIPAGAIPGESREITVTSPDLTGLMDQVTGDLRVEREPWQGPSAAPGAKIRSTTTGTGTAGPGRSRSAGSQTAAGTGSSFAAGPRPRSRTSCAPSTRSSPRASAHPPATPSSSA